MNISSVIEGFNPGIVITLIADVFKTWQSTESRWDIGTRKLLPTLEQHILARRSEILLGDLIANNLPETSRNFVYSVNHPTEHLCRYISQFPKVVVVYLSFQIAYPRELQKRGDSSGITMFSEFVRSAFDYFKSNQRVVLECPLSIDEYPMTYLNAANGNEEIEFDSDGNELVEFDIEKHRWPLDILYPGFELLGPAPTGILKIPIKQLENVKGAIKSDVTTRDYRLVDQSQCIVVFNPVSNSRDEMAGSVQYEMEAASVALKPVFVFQNSLEDSLGTFDRYLLSKRNPKASMESPESSNMIERCDSIDVIWSKIREMSVKQS